MTRKELANQIKVFEKWNRKSTLPLLAIMLVGTFLLAGSAKRVTEEFKTPVTVALFAWLLGYGYISTRIQKKKLRSLNLHCPICDAQLAGQYATAGQYAVATLHCGNCGNKILEEDRDSEPVASNI